MPEMNNFLIEFYYTSKDPRHLQQLHLVERVVHEARRDGSSVLLTFINCDDPLEPPCPHIPSLPCLRRISPRPERLILAPLDTFGDISRALGLPSHLHSISGLDLDLFQGNPGSIPPSSHEASRQS